MKVSLLTAAALIGVFGLTACTGPSRSTSPAPASPAPTTASTASAQPSGTAEAQSADPAAAQPPVQPISEPPAQSSAPTAGLAQSAPDKVHFTGDHARADVADSAKIIELARQWHSAEKEALFHEKMDGSGLSSNVPAEQAEAFYGQAATACQRRFDGHTPPLEGVGLEIENLALSVYCPELG